MVEEELMGTKQAAEEIGVSRRQIQTMINRGQLQATKVARDWFIKPGDLELVRVRSKGRPSKKSGGETKPIIHADTPVEVAPVEVEPVTVATVKVAPVTVKPVEVIKPAKKKK